MYCTTLNRIKAHAPCTCGWKKLLKSLGKKRADDALLPFTHILDSNGLDDALWCFCSCPEFDRLQYHYAIWCAMGVQHLMSKDALKLLDATARYADGIATYDELRAARLKVEDEDWSAAGSAARYVSMGKPLFAAQDAVWAAELDEKRTGIGTDDRKAQADMLRKIFSASSIEDAIRQLAKNGRARNQVGARVRH